MCKLFREYLDSKGFVEIHTPKIIPGMTNGSEILVVFFCQFFIHLVRKNVMWSIFVNVSYMLKLHFVNTKFQQKAIICILNQVHANKPIIFAHQVHEKPSS